MSFIDYVKLISLAGLVILLIGLVLIMVSDALKKDRVNYLKIYIHRELLPDIEKTVMDVMDDAMESIPYKIMDAKQILKESDM